jgi:hypothetical protein
MKKKIILEKEEGKGLRKTRAHLSSFGLHPQPLVWCCCCVQLGFDLHSPSPPLCLWSGNERGEGGCVLELRRRRGRHRLPPPTTPGGQGWTTTRGR